jgi:hypothetical protein
MLTTIPRLARHLLPIAFAALQLTAAQTSAQTRQENFIYASPSLSVSSDPSVVTSCGTGNASHVRLNARASSPGGNPIKYKWSTSSGQIIGDGAAVTWDLSGVAPGSYKAFVEIDTGTTDAACQAFSSTTVIISPCPTPQPVCPNMEIICPTNIVPDQPLTFSSKLVGGISAGTPAFNWTVSAGTIIAGQGTDTIKVDTTGLAGQTVRASLSMGGYTLDCAASCAAQIPLPEVKGRKFDEYPSIARNDEKARLDNYAVELQSDPTSTAYIIVYPGRSSKPGEAQRHTTRQVDYLVNSRGIDARRIVTVAGRTKDELMVELWLVPQGATPPGR